LSPQPLSPPTRPLPAPPRCPRARRDLSSRSPGPPHSRLPTSSLSRPPLQIYDIKYFNRDYRHAGAVGGLPVSKTQVVRMEKTVGGPDIPGGDNLDGPVPAVFGNRSHSLNTRSDLAPSGYTGDAETPTA